MNTRKHFDAIKRGNMTKLDIHNFVDTATDNFNPVKLKMLLQDLDNYITRFYFDIRMRPSEMIWPVFEKINEDTGHEIYTNVLKNICGLPGAEEETFQDAALAYIQQHGYEAVIEFTDAINNLEKVADEMYGKGFTNQYLNEISLTKFRTYLNDLLVEAEKQLLSENNPIGRQPVFDLQDTLTWFHELKSNPDYQHANGSPYYSNIDLELISRHKRKSGQKPSIDTIKVHRRKLGLMHSGTLSRGVKKG